MWRQRCHSSNRANSGRASLEFLVAGIVLFVPVMWASVVLLEIQKASMATDAAARHAVRVFTQSTSLDSAGRRAERAVSRTLGDFGVATPHQITVECQPRSLCLSPTSWAVVTVRTDVPLLGIPAFPLSTPWAVPVDGTAAAQVSMYRGIP